jgi:hypothetical protein
MNLKSSTNTDSSDYQQCWRRKKVPASRMLSHCGLKIVQFAEVLDGSQCGPADCMPINLMKSTHSSDPMKVLDVRTKKERTAQICGLPWNTFSMTRSAAMQQ